MFKSSPFAGLVPFRGNSSVPSIGGTVSLDAALVAVERAEQSLEAARAQARAAARHEGKGTRHLFSEGRFVSRANAEKWCDEARNEGRREVIDAQLRASGQDPEKVRADIKARLPAERAAAEARHERWETIMRKAGWHDAVASGDHALAGRIMFEMHNTLTEADAHVVPREVVERMERERPGKTKADQILAAGRRARMSGDRERPEPDKGSLAAQIILAGKKRRNEV